VKPPKERVMDVLAHAFRGIHHCPKIHVIQESGEWCDCAVNTSQDLSTFDWDVLTRLVFAAHDACVRVEIAPSGPGRVKIMLWARNTRTGGFARRHPTLGEAVEEHRKEWKLEEVER